MSNVQEFASAAHAENPKHHDKPDAVEKPTLLRKWLYLDAMYGDPDLSDGAKVLAHALLGMLDPDGGFARRGYAKLGLMTGRSAKSAQRAVVDLVKAGWFFKENIRAGARHEVNRYRPAWNRAVARPAEADETYDQNCPYPMVKTDHTLPPKVTTSFRIVDSVCYDSTTSENGGGNPNEEQLAGCSFQDSISRDRVEPTSSKVRLPPDFGFDQADVEAALGRSLSTEAIAASLVAFRCTNANDVRTLRTWSKSAGAWLRREVPKSKAHKGRYGLPPVNPASPRPAGFTTGI